MEHPSSPERPSPRRRSILGSVWRGTRATVATPFLAFPASQIIENARLIRALARQIGNRDRRPEPQVFLDDDGRLDELATSFRLGLTTEQLRVRLAARRRQTASWAYASFGLGCVFLALWTLRSLAWEFHGSRVLAALEFTPFCVIFFIVAFKYAHQNWQLRTGRLGSAGDYLRSPEPFLPR